MLSQLAISGAVRPADQQFLQSFYTIDSVAPWHLSLLDGVYRIENRAENLALTLDFRNGHYRHRQQHPAKEPLAKAVKIKQKLPDTLIDATPGVLKDSLMLASRGVRVTAFERNPLLFVMVRQALACVPTPVTIDYRFSDARSAIPTTTAEVIYLDPMYPSKKKAAQVKKDMQVLHHIIGDDADADQLFAVARTQNARTVVKRPSYASPLAAEKPSFVSQTGATRFDVYLPVSPA